MPPHVIRAPDAAPPLIRRRHLAFGWARGDRHCGMRHSIALMLRADACGAHIGQPGGKKPKAAARLVRERTAAAAAAKAEARKARIRGARCGSASSCHDSTSHTRSMAEPQTPAPALVHLADLTGEQPCRRPLCRIA
jgi:hypothetical protein